MSRLLTSLVLAGLLALAGCTGVQDSGDRGFVSGEGRVTQVAAAQREQPVSLQGEDLDGTPLDLADYAGKPVVVVVWGSWCGPCRAEAPDVVAAAEQLGDRAQFLGLNIRDSNQAQAQAFVRSFDIPYPSFYSPDGRVMLSFDGTLTPNSIPSFVVLDGQGRVAASIIGRLPSTTTLVELVADVDKGSADG